MIPSYLPFALADSFTSTLDVITLFKYIYLYGLLIVRDCKATLEAYLKA